MLHVHVLWMCLWPRVQSPAWSPTSVYSFHPENLQAGFIPYSQRITEFFERWPGSNCKVRNIASLAIYIYIHLNFMLLVVCNMCMINLCSPQRLAVDKTVKILLHLKVLPLGSWSLDHISCVHFQFCSQEFLPIETIRLRRLRLVVLQDLRSLRHMPWPPELRTCTCVYFDLQASDLAQQQAALRKDITAAAKKVGDAHVMIWSKPLDPIANFKIFWVGSIGERSRKGGEGWSEGKS